MNIVVTILLIFYGLIALQILYVLVFSVAGWLGRVPAPLVEGKSSLRRIAVLVPAYKEDFVIVDTARQALLQDYPQSHYEVIIIADSLQPATLNQLATLAVRVVQVSFEVSTKAKAINSTLAQLENTYDVAVVLDADNVMASDFLTRINEAFEGGWKVVQAHRVAKNTNTSMAILDAVSEELNNHLFRKGHRVLGLSGSLIGSGMAFDFTLFKRYMSQIDTTSGFDRELALRLIGDRFRIEYLEGALCYDEKVQSLAVFEKQRSRWLAAQMKYLRRTFRGGIKALFRGNFDYFDISVQNLVLPRVMLLSVLSAGPVLALLVGSVALLLFTGVQLFLLLFCFYVAIPSALRKLLTWQEIQQVPLVFFRYVRSLTRIGEAGKRFIHTPHNTTSGTVN